ncbi:MAG TPA: hypothetical protein PKC91_11225 [Ignavibacteria bacterium]|nr:hypothetical protein [Ignavibacteria bacterium]
MSDNKINPDSEEPHHNKTPINNPDNRETPEKSSPDAVNNSGNIKDESAVNEVNSSDITSGSLPDDEKLTESADEKINSGNTSNTSSEDLKDPEIPEKGVADADNTVSEDEKAIPSVKPQSVKKPKESNYQISLISENLLKVLVTSKKSGVKIDSSVKDNITSEISQSNEIYYNPRIDLSLQEVEVLIAIDEDEKSGEADAVKINDEPEIQTDKITDNPKSNYQINLINENLLKVKISTGNGVHIDSSARDKKNLFQTQSNKIYLKMKAEKQIQDIEITIAIVHEMITAKDDLTGIPDDGKIRLIPNPEVVDLIQPPDYSPFLQGDDPYQIEDNSYKNPFDALRHLIRKNITIGLIAAVILHLAAAGFAYYSLSKKSKDAVQEEPSRLIVLQDLPDPKIKLEDVEDPSKPKIEPPVLTEEQEREMREPKRELPPRKVVKPPTVTRPKRERDETKLDSSVEANLNRELDSIRKLREQMLTDSNITATDSTKSDSSVSAYEIPDSLKNNFNENDIGLAMYFPKNWKLTDQRDINKNEKEFKGVVITDTTAEQPGTMTLFIFLDNENKDYNAEDFKTEFTMLDSNLTAFSKEPKTLAGFTEYRFYIFNKLGTEKLSLRASVRKQFFEQYKNEIEAVVRSIKIRKKEDM